MASRIATLNNFASLSPPWLLSSLDQNSTNITTFANDSSLGYVNAISTDTGSANNYSVTCIFGAPTSYNAGMLIAFIPANTNTSSSVITVSPLGSLSIVDLFGNAITAGAILANRLCVLVCMGTTFRVVNTFATGGVTYDYEWDDFTGNFPKFLTAFTANGGSSGNYGTQIVGHPGNWQLIPNVSTTGLASLVGGFVFLDTFTITMRTICQVSAFAGAQQFFFGLGNGNSYQNPILATNQYIIFRAQSSSSSNWLCQTIVGSSVTSTSSGVAVSGGTEVDLMFVATASSVSFYINQTLVATNTTNIPASNVALNQLVVNAANGSTNDNSFLLDTFEYKIDTGTPKHFLLGPI